MKKIQLLIFTALILFSSLIMADFDEQKAYSWLISQSSDGSFNNQIVDTSLAALTLDKVNILNEVDKSVSYLLSQENAQHCFPKSTCKVKDTALVLLVLNKATYDTSDLESWLENAQSPANLNGKWFLQVVTAGSGTCNIKYTKNQQEIEKEIQVEEGKFPECGGTTFYDIDQCLDQGILKKNPSLELEIDCSSISSSSTISLVYQEGNNYYLTHEASGPIITIIVSNGCFGQLYRSSCNYESSLYAAWALNQINSNIDTTFYLAQNYKQTNPLHASINYLTTQKQSYLDDLIKLQKSDGSFDNDIYITSFAILALKDSTEQDVLLDAVEWLKKQQKEDGSFGSVIDTSISLYAIPEISLTGYCGDGICGIDEDEIVCPEDCTGGICNYNYICETDLGENYETCPSDCFEESACDYDYICDPGEDYINCPTDCEKEGEEEEEIYREDEEYLEEPEEEEEIIPTTEPKKSKFPWWIILILILFIGGIFYYYYAFKRPSKKKNKPIFQTNQFGQLSPINKPVKKEQPKRRFFSFKPQQPKTTFQKRSSEIDKELDKSIQEAKKLLKK